MFLVFQCTDSAGLWYRRGIKALGMDPITTNNFFVSDFIVISNGGIGPKDWIRMRRKLLMLVITVIEKVRWGGGGGANLKCNTFCRIDATRVLSSSSFRVMDEVTVRKNILTKKIDLTKLEQFFEQKVAILVDFPMICYPPPPPPQRIISITSFIIILYYYSNCDVGETVGDSEGITKHNERYYFSSLSYDKVIPVHVPVGIFPPLSTYWLRQRHDRKYENLVIGVGNRLGESVGVSVGGWVGTFARISNVPPNAMERLSIFWYSEEDKFLGL